MNISRSAAYSVKHHLREIPVHLLEWVGDVIAAFVEYLRWPVDQLFDAAVCTIQLTSCTMHPSLMASPHDAAVCTIDLANRPRARTVYFTITEKHNALHLLTLIIEFWSQNFMKN